MSSQPAGNPVRARRSNLDAEIEVAAETTTTITAARLTPKIPRLNVAWSAGISAGA